jgi:structure-specific recognition protein 1
MPVHENRTTRRTKRAAQVFHDTVKDRAKIGQVSGDLILSFEDVLVLTPYGRYDMDMFPTFLRFRGKTYDYKIVYPDFSFYRRMTNTFYS